MSDKTDPIRVFIASFGVASFAGLAALLRSGKKLTWVSVASATLNSGILGLTIALLWYMKFKENTYFLVGLCALAGLGGVTVMDFIFQILKGGGIHIRVEKGDADELPEESK